MNKAKNNLEDRKEPNKKSKDKCLYTCEIIIDSNEYKKMAKYFPQIYWSYVLWGTILNLFFSLILALTSKSLASTLTFLVCYQVFIMIIYRVRLEQYAEKSFNVTAKKGKIDTKIHTEFYDEYFIRKGETETNKILYSDIDKCVETDTNFYLKYSAKNKIVFIQKNACDLELINFIKDKFKNLENHIENKSNVKVTKKSHNSKNIENGMTILFIITILSLWCALYSMGLVDTINPKHGSNFIKNMWVFWCYLPIPILSVILGLKYKRVGLKCTKNIVAGFIVGFLLLASGSLCFAPTFSEDYTKIEKYQEIIDASLPKNGELEIQNVTTHFDENKTEYVIINAYYDKEDVTTLVKSIKHNDSWILSTDIKSELKIFIPLQLYSGNDAYFSIYNKTTNEYNLIPENTGDYEIYAMKYDISDKQLEIHKFKYSYNK